MLPLSYVKRKGKEYKLRNFSYEYTYVLLIVSSLKPCLSSIPEHI